MQTLAPRSGNGYLCIMCTVVLLRRPDHDWPLIMAANRDELLSRPWRSPGRHWPDRADVVAGIDELAGGTWLGINEFGVISAVLNRQGSLGPKDGYRSRGELPLEALDHADARVAAEAVCNIDPAAYRPFNMVIADNTEAYWVCLSEGADQVTVTSLPPGLSMITSQERNDYRSARIRAYLPRFQSAAEPDPVTGDWSEWQRLLGSRIYDPDDGPSGAMTIVTDNGFGTSSSSLLALPAIEYIDSGPVWLFAAGRPGDVAFEAVEL